MVRTLLIGFGLFVPMLAQPAAGPDSVQPLFPAEPVKDSVQPVSLFRPKVVVHKELILPKDPFLAGALSLVLPGTGQAYCGRWGRGAVFLAGAFIPYILAGSVSKNERLTDDARSGMSGIFVLIGLGVHAWSVIDGINTANIHNRHLIGEP